MDEWKPLEELFGVIATLDASTIAKHGTWTSWNPETKRSAYQHPWTWTWRELHLYLVDTMGQSWNAFKEGYIDETPMKWQFQLSLDLVEECLERCTPTTLSNPFHRLLIDAMSHCIDAFHPSLVHLFSLYAPLSPHATISHALALGETLPTDPSLIHAWLIDHLHTLTDMRHLIPFSVSMTTHVLSLSLVFSFTTKVWTCAASLIDNQVHMEDPTDPMGDDRCILWGAIALETLEHACDVHWAHRCMEDGQEVSMALIHWMIRCEDPGLRERALVGLHRLLSLFAPDVRLHLLSYLIREVPYAQVVGVCLMRWKDEVHKGSKGYLPRLLGLLQETRQLYVQRSAQDRNEVYVVIWSILQYLKGIQEPVEEERRQFAEAYQGLKDQNPLLRWFIDEWSKKCSS